MSRSREKLLEARYFLGLMRKSSEVPRVFRYNLSAYLSAARSVTFVLQAEYRHSPGFAEWYAEIRASLASDQTARILAQKRRHTIHLGKMVVHSLREFDIKTARDPNGEPLYPPRRVAWNESTQAWDDIDDRPKVPLQTIDIKRRYIFRELPGEDVLYMAKENARAWTACRPLRDQFQSVFDKLATTNH